MRVAGGEINGADGGVVSCVCPEGWCRNREEVNLVLASLAVRICLLTEQPVARAVSCGRGAASVGSWWTSEVGGR